MAAVHKDAERLIAKKLRASVGRLGTVTNAEFANWVQNPADLAELVDCIVAMAGNQAHADNTPASSLGMVGLIPADGYQIAGNVVTCVMDVNDMDDNGGTMATVEKIADAVPQEPNTVQFKVIGYTGSDEGLVAIAEWLPLGRKLNIPSASRMIFLSFAEAALAKQEFEAQKGKIDLAESHKPVEKLVHSLTMSGAKEHYFKIFLAIKYLFPMEKFNAVFMKFEDIAKATEYAELHQFSIGRAKEHMNTIVKRLDPRLLNGNVYLFTEKGAVAFLSFNFGAGADQISTASIIKSSEKSNSIATITQRHQNLRFVLQIMRSMFIPDLVDAVEKMIQDVKDQLKPTSAGDFSTVVDALLHGMSQPPPEVCGSQRAIFQHVQEVVFDLSPSNQLVEEYKQEANAKIQADLTATTDAMRLELQQLRDRDSAGANAARSFGNQHGFGPAGNQKRKNTYAAASAPKVARPSTFQDRLQEWLSKAPVQPPAGRVHICGRTAKGLSCDKETRGAGHAHNRENAHVEEPWMKTPAYRAWAKLRPLYVEPKV